MHTKKIALVIVAAGLYLALSIPLQGLAFGAIQVRIADALYPVIAVLGLPWLLGTFIGQLVFNTYGFGVGIALSAADLLSPLIFLIPKILIWKIGLKAVPIHVVFVALWVGFLVSSLFGVPYFVAVLTVGIGETIAEVCGVPIALSLRKKKLNLHD